MATTQWFEATIRPVREGFYDVRVAPMWSGAGATIDRTLWKNGAWWAHTNGECMATLAAGCTWRGLEGVHPKSNNRLPTPYAVCSGCYYAIMDIARVDGICQRCYKSSGGKSKIPFHLTMTLGDWATCPDCHGTGERSASQCRKCKGVGCLLSRPGGLCSERIGPPRAVWNDDSE